MPIPRAPRLPRAPAPKPPRLPGPIRLAPIRTPASLDTDDEVIKGRRVGDAIPYVRWDVFLERVKFEQGQHITIVGTTGSGKTVLERELVKTRFWTVLLGTKNEDRELYEPFEKAGFEITDDFDPTPEKADSRVIFRPRMSTPDAAGLRKQRDAFESMLFEVFEARQWRIVADEIWYLTNRLRLADTFETFWSQGRSMGITVVACTQLPVSIPLMAFDQATHLFLFRNTDQYRIKRMAEFSGADSALLRSAIPLLPRFEFIYVDTRTGLLLRSKANI